MYNDLQQRKIRELELAMLYHSEGCCTISCSLCIAEMEIELEDSPTFIELNKGYQYHLIHRSFISYPDLTSRVCSYCREELYILQLNDKNIIY